MFTVNFQKDYSESFVPKNNPFPWWLNFLSGREVVAFAYRCLIAAAVDRLRASSNALKGLLANSKAKFSTAIAVLFPNCFKEFHNPSAVIVLTESFLNIFLT